MRSVAAASAHWVEPATYDVLFDGPSRAVDQSSGSAPWPRGRARSRACDSHKDVMQSSTRVVTLTIVPAVIGLAVRYRRPAPLVLAGFAALQTTLAGPEARLMFDRSRSIRRARDDVLREALDARLDRTTHGEPQNDLRAIIELATQLGPAARREARLLRELDARLAVAARRASGDPAAGRRPDSVAVEILAGNRNLATRKYGRPVTHPWVRDRWLGHQIEQLGRIVDEVRSLHNDDIERAVLLLTFWSRSLLVAASPVLGAVSAAEQPMGSGFELRDVPWLAALVIAAGTALHAGRVADAVMDQSPRGEHFRRRMSRVEAPVVAALCVTSPAWTACVFASGWHNYMHRPDFSWRRFCFFGSGLLVAQGGGLALQDVSIIPAARECGLTIAAVLVTGGSYGAMLPITVAVFIDTVVSGASHRYRITRSAREDLISSAEALERLSATVSRESREIDAQRAVVMAMAASRRLRAAVDALEREGVVPRSGLRDLVLRALEDEGFDDIAHSRADRPTHSGPRFRPKDLSTRRITKRAHREALVELLRLLLAEARIHGRGEVAVVLELAEPLVTLTVANPISTDDQSVGGGTGRDRILVAARRLPGGRSPKPLELADGSPYGFYGDATYVASASFDADVLTPQANG